MVVDLVAKLRRMEAKNSPNKSPIKEFSTKSGEVFFGEVREGQHSSAPSLRFQRDSSCHSDRLRTDFYLIVRSGLVVTADSFAGGISATIY